MWGNGILFQSVYQNKTDIRTKKNLININHAINMSRICWAFISLFSTLAFATPNFPIKSSLKALRHNYKAKFIDCAMAHFMIPSFVDCFKYRNRTHVRQNVIYSLLQMLSCVVFLASAFIFLNQYNRTWSFMCFICSASPSPSPTLDVVCTK